MNLIALGMLLIMVGFLLIFGSLVLSSIEEKQGEGTNLEAGGVIMVGPIPIIFGTSRDMALIVLAMALVLMGLLYLLR